METKKNHYRNVLKSDHLGIADLEDMIEAKQKLIFTISHAKQERGATVAGRKGDFNVVYFKENIKPLVVNSTNGKQIAHFANSPFVEDWNNIPIELYIDESVKMKGETVGGIRIKPTQPQLNKVKPDFTEAMFERAKSGGYSVDKIKLTYTVSPEIETKYNKFELPKNETA